MRLLFCFIFTIFSSSLLAGKIDINSNPAGAEIFVKDTKSQKKIKLGTTPHSVELDLLVSKYAGSDVFVLEMTKDGFDPYRILISKTGENDVNLFVNLDIRKNIQEIKKIDLYTNELFEVQRLIRIKNYDTALSKLSDLEKKYPHYSTIYELTASALYLNKDFSKSLSYYRKAFAKNADNIDAYRMKTYLEKKLSIKPAGDK